MKELHKHKTKNHINIMFLGGAKRVSLGERFIAAGKKIKKKVNLYSYELTEDVPIRCIAKIINGLKWKDEKIIEHIKNVIYKENIDILIPNVDPSISILATLKLQLQDDKKLILVSDKKLCELFYNKKSSYEWFLDNGFLVPESEPEQFPMVAKPITGSASKGIRILKNKQELESYFNSIEKNEEYIIQRYIEGEEFTVDCYVSVKDNEVKAIVPRRRIEVIDGEVSKSITLFDEELIQISKNVVRKTGLIGPFNIQYIREKSSGRTYVIEINPRFGGGVINSIEAGADMPLMVLYDYFGIKIEEVKKWSTNLLMLRANREVFVCK